MRVVAEVFILLPLAALMSACSAQTASTLAKLRFRLSINEVLV